MKKFILQLAVVFAFICSSQLTNAQLVSSTGETLVNTTTTDSTQQNCAISMDTLGRYVIVWESEFEDGDGFGIFAKVYNADHTVRVPDFEITTTADDRVNDQRFPDVAMNAEGTWCVTWQSQEDQRFDTGFGEWITQGWDVYRRIFDIDGTAVSGRSRVNSSTTGNQMHAAVAASDDRFVVTYMSEVSGQDESEIHGRVTLANGAWVMSSMVVHSLIGSHMAHPDVATTVSNDYTFTWQVESLDGDRNGIYTASYNNSYTQTVVPTQVNTTTTGNQQEPRIAMDEYGEFMIVWSSFNQDGDHYGIFGQRFLSPGTPSGGEIAITTNTAGSQDHAAIAVSREGGKYIISWTDDSADGDKSGVYSRTMYSNGSFLDIDALINTTTANYQSFSDVAIGNDTTQAVFAWQSGVRDGSTGQTDDSYYGIYYQGVVIEDITPPVAVCQNINLYLDGSGNASIVPADVDGGSTDNVGITSMTTSISAFTCADIGTNVVALTVYDAAGLSDNCNSTVTVLDTISPVLTCMTDLTIECHDDDSPAALGYSTATDNCDATPTVLFSDVITPGSCANESTIYRTWTATDNEGNTSSCLQTITVNDVTAPVASNPAAVNVECIGDVPANDVTVVIGETDNCTAIPIVTFVSDASDGNTCPEVITRTYSVKDDCDNETLVTQTITVNDITAPVASNPAAVNVECIGDVPTIDITDVIGETDNCTAIPIVTFVSDATDGNTCPEVITRTYSVKDDCDNETLVTQTITVNDITAPVASNPAAVNVECIGDVPANDVTVVIGETDNCTAVPIVSFVSDASDGNSCPEVITRTYSVKDDCDNETLVTQTITVNDITAPVASNPAAVNVECISDVPANDVTVVIGETDNCTAIPTVTFVSDASDGNTCPEVITRTYSVKDDCDNETLVTQTITVNDITAPVASNPAAVNVECIGDVPANDVTVVIGETDNCTAVPIITFVSDASDGNSCPEVITRTYSVKDDCDNETLVTQTITVNDITAPTASNPVAVNVECIGDVPANDVTVVIGETDNCTATPTVTFVSDASDGNTCPEVITRTYSVTDDCGNETLVTQTITVSDITLPTASNPVAVNVECISDVPSADITVVIDELDNCTASPVVAFVSDVSDGLSCPETITRTYSVTDDCSNSINVTQTITVSDITLPTASNPVAVNVECTSDIPAADITVVIDELDNCTASPIVAFVSDVSDGLSCPETITRTYSVTDDCSNSINVTQTITVHDITNPAVDVAALSDVSEACSVTPIAPTATDNCDGVITATADVAFPITASGTTLVTWTYTDLCGNTTIQTQNIIVTVVDVTTSLGLDQVTITASNSNGTYVWIDCDNGNTIVPGETGQSFTSTVNGSYAVIVSENGCTDTSDCVIINHVGIDDINIETLIVYPNPSSDGVFKYDSEKNVMSVNAYDMQGRIVPVTVNTINKIIDASKLSQAKYIFEFILEGNFVVRKEVIIITD